MLQTLAIAVALLAFADDEQKPAKPDLEGAPVYLVHGMVVVFPKGVEQPAADYKGAIGKPLAVIKVDGKVVGEVYSSPLKGTPEEEAKGMAASPKKSEKIELKKQGTEKLGNQEAEYVTLKMNLKGTFGESWIVHSVYIPRDKSCITFKLVSSEEQFTSLLPYLTAMLTLAPDVDKKKE